MKLNYFINNIIKPPAFNDEKLYMMKRLVEYNRIYYMNNLNSLNKKYNLCPLLYSKYYTQRYIISRLHDEKINDDEEIILHYEFPKLLNNNKISSKNEFENNYLTIIKKFKRNDYFELYKSLNERFVNNKLNENEKDLFVYGTSDTDIFLYELSPKRSLLTNLQI